VSAAAPGASGLGVLGPSGHANGDRGAAGERRRAVAGEAGRPPWTVREAPWLLVALHLPFVVSPPLFTITRRDLPAGEAAAVVAVALALGALQLHHSLAASQLRRPRAWAVSLLTVVALTYVPMWWYTWDWAVAQWMVIASAAMVLRGRPAVLATLPALGTGVVTAYTLIAVDRTSMAMAGVWAVYYTAVLAMGAAALYGSARLVGVIAQLDAARSEVAELAVGRERLRVSRDLHDLLGQSLSAVSLKGDLAIRLLATDADAARSEIESLTGVARGALRDVRAVARDEHAVSLAAEVDAAAALLGAAGVAVRVEVDLPDPAYRVEEVLAWAVREGATNTLRHSDATTCSITAERAGGRARLAIVNDGARGTASGGRGLAGLAERARELSGSVTARPAGGDSFRLVVEIPEERP
jgi:two-component system, NarL family, sensor histidine kinase DesK